MPNRVIRDGFLDSEKINTCSESAQLLFVRLALVVDDFGCYDGRPEKIKSACYPVSDKSLADVRQMTDELTKQKLIIRYVNNDKHYLFIPNFKQRMRIQRRKFPPPENCPTNDGQMSVIGPTNDGLNPNPNPNLNPNLNSNLNSNPNSNPKYKERKTPADGGSLKKSLSKKSSEKIAFILNNEKISWPYWQRIINMMHGDKFAAGRIFYRAFQKAKPEGIINWIEAGLKGKKQYALLPIEEESTMGASVGHWIDKNIFKFKDDSCQKIGDVLGI